MTEQNKNESPEKGIKRPLAVTDSTARLKARIVAAIPCYNTQKFIAAVVTETRPYVDHVIVVDDGSTDATAEEARKAGAEVICHPRNLGKGAAMKTAARSVDADLMVFIDGDGQHNPDEIPEMIALLDAGKADFVIGSRYLKESQLTSNPFIRKAANALASLVISLIVSVFQPALRFIKRKPSPIKPSACTSANHAEFQQDTVKNHKHYRILNGKFKWISDCTSGYTAARKACWDKLDLVSDRYQIETEVIFEQVKHGFIIAEMPINCVWGKSGSKLSIVNDGMKTLALLLKKLIKY